MSHLPPSSPVETSSPATAAIPTSEPAPIPLPVLVSAEAVTQISMLYGLARIGAAVPEHILAFLLRCHPDAVGLATVLVWQERLLAMAREGLVELSWCAVPAGRLRYFDRTLARLTEAGRARAADGTDKRSWRLGIIGEHTRDGSWLLEEAVRQVAFADWAEAKHVRQWLKTAAGQGLVEIRPTRLAHRAPVFSMTPKGRDKLEQEVPGATAHVPQLARPAEAVMVHHLHMLRAAAWMMAVSPPDRALLYIQSDADLASAAKRGRRSRQGDHYPAVPDGRIHLVKVDRWVIWDVEVIGNYKADDIREKYRVLPKRTTFVAISNAVADRVSALGLPRPEVV